MLRYMKKNIWILIVLAMVTNLISCGVIGSTSRKSVPGIPDPIQKEASGGTSFELDGYTVNIDYKYSYDISALVVSTHEYSDYDIAGKLAPKDLALAWGPVAEYNDRIDFNWSQSNRWYYWETKTYDEINVVGGVDGVSQHSANNHLIAADDTVKKQIKSINAGDYVNIKGYLVNLSAAKPDGTNFWWNSSKERTDTGDGSCELIYVTSVEWLE
ncbi:MAG: hypothetical protein IJ232_07330 [Lachnospiraceae bacterium]|nr:hypothetical protein [Lachnospiraceae bacterium]